MCKQATGDCQTTNSHQADLEEKIPDLTRLFKNRARDSDVIKKCKRLLIAGMPPGRVALVCRLPLEKVLELYNSYNPRCRRFANRNSYQDSKLALTMFHQGESLADICAALGGLHLYTVVMSLRQNGIAESAIEQRLLWGGDRLCMDGSSPRKQREALRDKA